MLLLAIVVARDGARPDVDVRSDLGIAKICQVLALGPRTESGFLQFHEVADARFRTDLRLQAQAGERPDVCVRIDARLRNQRIWRHDDAVGKPCGFEHRALSDVAIFADSRMAGEPRERLDDGIRTDADLGVDGHGFGTFYRDAGEHQLTRFARAQNSIGVGQLDARVDAEQLAEIVHVELLHAFAVAIQDCGHIG